MKKEVKLGKVSGRKKEELRKPSGRKTEELRKLSSLTRDRHQAASGIPCCWPGNVECAPGVNSSNSFTPPLSCNMPKNKFLSRATAIVVKGPRQIGKPNLC